MQVETARAPAQAASLKGRTFHFCSARGGARGTRSTVLTELLVESALARPSAGA
jgi:hypothetical protein